MTYNNELYYYKYLKYKYKNNLLKGGSSMGYPPHLSHPSPHHHPSHLTSHPKSHQSHHTSHLTSHPKSPPDKDIKILARKREDKSDIINLEEIMKPYDIEMIDDKNYIFAILLNYYYSNYDERKSGLLDNLGYFKTFFENIDENFGKFHTYFISCLNILINEIKKLVEPKKGGSDSVDQISLPPTQHLYSKHDLKSLQSTTDLNTSSSSKNTILDTTSIDISSLNNVVDHIRISDTDSLREMYNCHTQLKTIPLNTNLMNMIRPTIPLNSDIRGRHTGPLPSRPTIQLNYDIRGRPTGPVPLPPTGPVPPRPTIPLNYDIRGRPTGPLPFPPTGPLPLLSIETPLSKNITELKQLNKNFVEAFKIFLPIPAIIRILINNFYNDIFDKLHKLIEELITTFTEYGYNYIKQQNNERKKYKLGLKTPIVGTQGVIYEILDKEDERKSMYIKIYKSDFLRNHLSTMPYLKDFIEHLSKEGIIPTVYAIYSDYDELESNVDFGIHTDLEQKVESFSIIQERYTWNLKEFFEYLNERKKLNDININKIKKKLVEQIIDILNKFYICTDIKLENIVINLELINIKLKLIDLDTLLCHKFDEKSKQKIYIIYILLLINIEVILLLKKLSTEHYVFLFEELKKIEESKLDAKMSELSELLKSTIFKDTNPEGIVNNYYPRISYFYNLIHNNPQAHLQVDLKDQLKDLILFCNNKLLL